MKKDIWVSHIEACDRSGKSRMAYAKAHGLVYSQLLYWARKITSIGAPTKPKPDKKFTAVQIKKPLPVSTGMLGIIEFPNGATLQIHDPALLANLSSVLNKPS